MSFGSDNILSVDAVGRTFGSDQREVISSISLNIKRGESIVILGPSGGGKTVFMKMLAGLLRPTSGLIVFNDEIDIAKAKSRQIREYMSRVGYLFQMNALFDSYPIWKNIMITPVINDGMPKSVAMNIASESLKSVDLSPDILNYYPDSISGGMQKRVALARALVGNPDIIFFDEPTSGLDPMTSKTIGNLIRDCKKDDGTKITKISIIHDLEIAKMVADRVVVLGHGHLEWEGSVHEMAETSVSGLYNASHG